MAHKTHVAYELVNGVQCSVLVKAGSQYDAGASMASRVSV